MISLFPSSLCAPTAADVSFTPLFRFLDDFDTHSREAQSSETGSAPRRHHHHRQRRSQLATFNPKFDVRETGETYELHGELPGLNRENVNIEFTDAQTIVISGRVERRYGSEPNTTTPTATNNNNNNNNNNSIAEAGEAETEKPRRNSHQATVEDDPEDTPASTPGVSTPATEVAKLATEPETSQAVTQTQTQTQTEPQDEPKHWHWERLVGEFSRAFTFQARVDHDRVAASLNNGILSVTVPKSRKPVTRRIEVSA